jgi:hypothetical protein
MVNGRSVDDNDDVAVSEANIDHVQSSVVRKLPAKIDNEVDEHTSNTDERLEYGNDNEADEENAVGGKYKLVK